MNMLASFLRAWIGSQEYYEVWHKQARTWSFPMRFWGRIVIALTGAGFFAWQQVTQFAQGSGIETFTAIVLVLTITQAIGPLSYLLFKFTKQFFVTEDYLDALSEGRWYFTMKSSLCMLSSASFSIFVVSGSLGAQWYMKPLAFLLTVPIVWFWIIIPAFNRFEVKHGRVSEFSKERRQVRTAEQK
jgi:uncharacterized membrane protein YkvI